MSRSETKLLAVWQIGGELTDVRVARWTLAPDDTAKYIDNRGERDHVFPATHDFEWQATSRADHILGRHPHVNILDTVFALRETRSDRLLNRRAIQPVDDNRWHVTGLTSLRRLGRYFGIELPETKTVTVAGVLQETLGRLPQQGDTCQWGAFHLLVTDVPRRGNLLVEITLLPSSRRASG